MKFFSVALVKSFIRFLGPVVLSCCKCSFFSRVGVVASERMFGENGIWWKS
jgi:hypothetical protein